MTLSKATAESSMRASKKASTPVSIHWSGVLERSWAVALRMKARNRVVVRRGMSGEET